MKGILYFSPLFFTFLAFGQQNLATEQELKSVTDQLFEGMRLGDSSMVRAAFHPEATMQTTFYHEKSGKFVLHSGSVDDFVQGVGTPHKEIWDERTTNYHYLIDANLAEVWMDYSFYFNGDFSHCGVNSIQLIKLADGWKISAITDTRRKTNCTDL